RRVQTSAKPRQIGHRSARPRLALRPADAAPPWLVTRGLRQPLRCERVSSGSRAVSSQLLARKTRENRQFRAAFHLVVLRLGLENRCRSNPTEGSNPSLSAWQSDADECDFVQEVALSPGNLASSVPPPDPWVWQFSVQSSADWDGSEAR